LLDDITDSPSGPLQTILQKTHQIEKLHDENQELHEIIDKKDQHILHLNSVVDEKTDECDQQAQQIQHLNCQNEHLDATNKELKKENEEFIKQMTHKNNELDQDNNHEKDKPMTQCIKINHFDIGFDDLLMEYNSIGNQIITAKEELARKKAKLLRQQKTIEKLFEFLNVENIKLKKNIYELAKNVRECMNKIENGDKSEKMSCLKVEEKNLELAKFRQENRFSEITRIQIEDYKSENARLVEERERVKVKMTDLEKKGKETSLVEEKGKVTTLPKTHRRKRSFFKKFFMIS